MNSWIRSGDEWDSDSDSDSKSDMESEESECDDPPPLLGFPSSSEESNEIGCACEPWTDLRVLYGLEDVNM